MEITEIRIKLMEESEDRLRAFCSITIDNCFVVRDLKIIDGTSGPFVAMPSRKLAGHCPRCGYKNHLRAAFCNHCGLKQPISSELSESPQKLYADVAHPINSACRELIQTAVLDEFAAELKRASQPGYRSRYDDDFLDVDTDVPVDPSFSIDTSIAPIYLADGPEPQVKRPHLDQPRKEASPVDNDDSFGAGIF